MRNLRIISYQETPNESELPLTATAWDTSNDSVICAFGPTPTNPIIELKRKTKLKTPVRHDDKILTTKFERITSWDAPCPLPDLVCDEILLMHYFSDTLTACVILAGGDIVLVREETEDGQERIEIVGSVDVGIAAAAWALDEELLAIVTRSDSLVLMSRSLELVTESTMTAEDLQASKHVSVGWGKKETQFHGKRAKAMRDPTMPEYVDEGLQSSFEDGRVTISWRGDGAYLAVSAVVADHRRTIRVFSRDGVLDSVSEPVDGLESAISWRPVGNLIASVKRSKAADGSNLEIVFFERNGLRHGEFPLRLKTMEADVVAKHISLSWNLDSSVLAVSFLGTVQFWTMGNYHYYLKGEIQVTNAATETPTEALWHNEKALKCCIGSPDVLLDIEYLFHVSRGSTVKSFDSGTVAVIDGAILKLTPLKYAGVPPPMAFCEVDIGFNIIDVAVSKDGQQLATLTRKGIAMSDWRTQKVTSNGRQKELRYSSAVDTHRMTWSDMGLVFPNQMQFTKIVFRKKNLLYAFAPAQKGLPPVCLRLQMWQAMSSDERMLTWVYSVDKIDISLETENILSDHHQTTIWLQVSGSTTCLVDQDDSAKERIKLDDGQVNTVVFQSSSDANSTLVNSPHSIFQKASLTTKGSLLVDGRVLARDCTSFVLTDLYLIYTTAQHLLKFVHLTASQNMEVPNDTPEVDERCRSIERGAKIITVIPSTYAVILQMPRGNLETIYPRVLVLAGIRESLRNLEYRAAFLACQNHQVDMNILCDYALDDFMINVGNFIEDLKKPSRVDEFLSKLKDEDVTKTLYRDTLDTTTEMDGPKMDGAHHITRALHKTGSEKVNRICDSFISILQKKPGKFLQCIITAHVCKRPPDLKAALTLVSSLRQSSTEEADLAVSHLCFLTDTNRLFDAALSLYDLELTLLVAQNAQRDPREYMPFLQNLQSLPSLRRQYQIDNHLRNYNKALTSLHAMEAQDEVEAYTVKHALYTHAMGLYKYAPKPLAKITTLYAKHLTSQSQHSSAATLYDSLGLYTEAYPLYALAHQWRESLTCATLIPLPPDEIHDLALSLAATCADEARDYRAAATIYTDYLSDSSTAAKLLCKGSYFADATRILSLHNLAQEIPATIDTGLTDKFSEILELVADCKSQLSAQVPRIQELRVKKAEDPLAFFGGDAAVAAANGVDIPDNVSLAPTDATTAGGQSLFTRYGGGSQGTRFGGTVASNVSRKTSKTKRREERKRARGKKGSVYEEEYLVASVGRLVEKVNGVHDEVQRLVSGLARRGMREQAKKVGEVMLEIGEACEKAKADVWGVLDEAKPIGNGVANGHDETVLGVDGVTEYRPSGADGVFWDSQQLLAEKKAAPVVKTWKVDVVVGS